MHDSKIVLGVIFTKFEKKDTLVGPIFFCTFLCQKYGKNRAAAHENGIFYKATKIGFAVLKNLCMGNSQNFGTSTIFEAHCLP